MVDSTAVTTVNKPETREQESWDLLESGEQKVVSSLHEIGLVFGNDVWPVVKASLGVLFSQLCTAVLGAITATIADPALLPSAVGSALLLTASTTGVADAKTALASAEVAIDADPTVQALLNPPAAESVANSAGANGST